MALEDMYVWTHTSHIYKGTYVHMCIISMTGKITHMQPWKNTIKALVKNTKWIKDKLQILEKS